MVAIALIDEARAAGLTVAADGQRLIIRGPRTAEHLARMLLSQKAEVLAALANMTVPDDANAQRVNQESPTAIVCPSTCRKCGSAILWLRSTGTTSCPGCKPTPIDATQRVVIVTLPDGRTELEPFKQSPGKQE